MAALTKKERGGQTCPLCGSPIDPENMYRCARFPICTYTLPKKTLFDIHKDPFILFDLETSGLDRRTDRIIEIGAVKVENGKIVDTFSQLLNPGTTQNGTPIFISSEITRLTGITNSDLEGQPAEPRGIGDFLAWAGGINMLAGHNIDTFDIPFLKAACKRARMPFPFRYSIDTLKFVRALRLKKKGYISNEKQTTIAAELVGFTYSAHRALDDVQALYRILDFLCRKGDPMISEISARR